MTLERLDETIKFGNKPKGESSDLYMKKAVRKIEQMYYDIVQRLNADIEILEEVVDGTDPLSHGVLDDLLVDDHTIYFLADGTRDAAYVNVTNEANGYQLDDVTYFTVQGPGGDDPVLLIGKNAGSSIDAGAEDGIAIGESAADEAGANAQYFVSIGWFAGVHANAWGGIYIGLTAGQFSTGIGNTVSGGEAGLGAENQSDYTYASLYGALSGRSLESGDYDSFFGARSGWQCTDGNFNSFFGGYSGHLCVDGDNNLFMGYYAGSNFTTENGRLVIDTYQRTTKGEHETESIIYGVMAAAPEDQTLTFNARCNFPQGIPAVCNNNEVVCHDDEIVFAAA